MSHYLLDTQYIPADPRPKVARLQGLRHGLAEHPATQGDSQTVCARRYPIQRRYQIFHFGGSKLLLVKALASVGVQDSGRKTPNQVFLLGKLMTIEIIRG